MIKFYPWRDDTGDEGALYCIHEVKGTAQTDTEPTTKNKEDTMQKLLMLQAFIDNFRSCNAERYEKAGSEGFRLISAPGGAGVIYVTFGDEGYYYKTCQGKEWKALQKDYKGYTEWLGVEGEPLETVSQLKKLLG